MKTECLEFCQDISFSELDLLIWCNTSQISESYFADINKIILIFLWRLRKLKRANTILKGRSKVRELTASDFKAYYAAKSLQLCPTLCDPIDGSPPGFPVPGILQARTLEWVAISLSNAWKWKVKVKSLSCVRLQRPHGLQPTRLLHPWDFLGKSTGVGCHCLLQINTLRHI